MKALLTALQEGRLIELPESDKTSALKFLGVLLEAVPEVCMDEDITEKAMQRELAHSTAIGKGWACPHASTKATGELLCAVGWSPAGIDFAAPDYLPVHLVVMYYVPDSQRHAYLKEISLLAKAINANEDLQHPQQLTDLLEIRHALLDAITHAINSVTPDSMARMIKLEARHAAAEAKAAEGSFILPGGKTATSIEAISIVSMPGQNAIVLSQNAAINEQLENFRPLVEEIEKNGRSICGPLIVIRRGSSHYAQDRMLHDCLVITAETK